MYEKYLDTLERTSFERILDTGAKIGAGVIISATLVNADAIRDLLIANDYMAIKIIAGM